MSRAVKVSLVLSVLSLLTAGVAVVLASRPAPSPGRPPVNRVEAQAEADRIRSATQLRQMVFAVHSYASSNDWSPPPPDRWRELLIEGQMLTPDMFEVRGGQPVDTPYHYIAPNRDELLTVTGQEPSASTRAPGDVIVLYEDPGLWGGAGGTLVFLDSSTRWVDGHEYADLVAGLKRP